MTNSHWVTFEDMEEGVVYIAMDITRNAVFRTKYRKVNNQLQFRCSGVGWRDSQLSPDEVRFTPTYVPPKPKPVWDDDLNEFGDMFEWSIIGSHMNPSDKWGIYDKAIKDMDDETLARFLKWREHLRKESE